VSALHTPPLLSNRGSHSSLEDPQTLAAAAGSTDLDDRLAPPSDTIIFPPEVDTL
jgi:hypothetical protein